MHWVVDVELLEDRARQLGLSAERASTRVQAALEALLPEARLHTSIDSFAQTIQDWVEDRTYNSEKVSSQTAMANGSLSEVYMPVSLWAGDFLNGGDVFEQSIVGSVTLDPDPDRMYYGHRVSVEATLTVPRLSARLFGEPELDVTDAELEWFGHSLDDDEIPEQPPLASLAEVLSIATGLDESDTQHLSVEVRDNAGDDGFVFSQILDFSHTPDNEHAAKLRARHPNMEVHVQPGFLDRVRTDRDGDLY